MASSQPYMHRTFKEIKIHTAKCDQCNKHNTATIYRCEDCSEQCCTPCWNRQGDDGKHLLNNALTVVIAASEADKKRSAKKKPAKVVKRRGKKTAITYRKIAKKPLQRKREIVDDDDDDDDLDDIGADSELGHGPIESTTTAYTKTRANKKQSNSRMPAPDLYEDSSNPDIEYRPIPHPKVTAKKPMKLVAGRLQATCAIKGLPTESTEHVQSKNDVVVHEGDTTDDDVPVCHIPPKATSHYSKEILKVSNANKRKRSEPSSEDRNASRDDHAASNRKKLRTSIRRNTGLAVDARPCPQAPAPAEETEADIREHAKNLLLFAQGFQHSSPTPSLPFNKTATLADVQSNSCYNLTDNKKARSSSPFADLPIWPPAPASKAAAVSSASSPYHDNYERATAPHAQALTAATPVPRDCISNRICPPSPINIPTNIPTNITTTSASITTPKTSTSTITIPPSTSASFAYSPPLNKEASPEQLKSTPENTNNNTFQRTTVAGEEVANKFIDLKSV